MAAWQAPIAGAMGVLVGYVLGAISGYELGTRDATGPVVVNEQPFVGHSLAAWSERVKTVPEPLPPVPVHVETVPAQPVIAPRVVEPVTVAAPAPEVPQAAPVSRDVCYPGTRQTFRYRGVWHWRCRY